MTKKRLTIRPPKAMRTKSCATVERIKGLWTKIEERVALMRALIRLALQDESQRARSEESGRGNEGQHVGQSIVDIR